VVLRVGLSGAVIGAIEELPPETVLELADDASG
jgi:hypothetical protein